MTPGAGGSQHGWLQSPEGFSRAEAGQDGKTSTSPTPCDLRYLIILTQPASPQLCQHVVKPPGKGGESRRERAPIPQHSSRAGGLGKPLQLQPLPVATRPAGAVSRPLRIPGAASRITPSPPGSAATRAEATRGSGILPDKEPRSRKVLLGHPLKDGLGAGAAAASARGGLEGAEHPWSRA